MKLTGFNRFLLTAGILYTLLFIIYEYVVKTQTNWDLQFISGISVVADHVLQVLGYATFPMREDGYIHGVGIDGSHGVWVGSGCNALTLFGLFGVFVIAWPGALKHKFWFIPLGIVFIHLLNIVRIVALAIIAYRFPNYLDFNHTYTFTFVIYSFIFGLWMVWVKRFSEHHA